MKTHFLTLLALAVFAGGFIPPASAQAQSPGDYAFPKKNAGIGYTSTFIGPSESRLLGFDDEGALGLIVPGDGLTLSGSTLTVTADGLPSQTGNSGKYLTTDGTDASWATISGGGDALTTNPLSQFAATTSAQLASVLSDETGTGAVVLANSPTLVTPALGTPSSLTLTNATGLPWSTGLTGTPTTLSGYGITDADTVLNAELKSADFTATAGGIYAIDDSGGAVTITLPASPSAGDVVTFYGQGTGWSNGVTVERNGESINASAANIGPFLSPFGAGPTHVLVYVGGATGWSSEYYYDAGTLTSLIPPLSIPLDYLSDTDVPQGFEADPANNEVLAFDTSLNLGSGAWTNKTAAEAGLLATSAIGSTVQAYDADLADLADGAINASKVEALPVTIGIALSDEETPLTTGTAKVTFRMPHAMTLTGVRLSVNTAPTGSTFIVDINEGGSSVLSTKLSIDATEKTSTTAATAAVISDSALADDAEITIDFDQVGATIAGAGAKIWLIGTR